MALAGVDDKSGQAWADFFEAHHAGLTAYAVSLVGNPADAQDLMQDVLIRMVRQHRAVGEARAYFMRCLRNAAVDRSRSGAVRHAAGSMDGLDVGFIDTTCEDVERRETGERVQAALSFVKPVRREVIVLKAYARMSFREIGEILGMPLGTVTSHYARGLDELREHYVEAIGHVT